MIKSFNLIKFDHIASASIKRHRCMEKIMQKSSENASENFLAGLHHRSLMKKKNNSHFSTWLFLFIFSTLIARQLNRN